MSSEQTFRDVMAAIQVQDWAKVRSMTTADFAFLGGPMPMNMDAFSAVQGAIQTAMPDFEFHIDNVTGEGDHLVCDLHVHATHTAALSLPLPGLPSIPATNKHLSVSDHLLVTLRDGKIATVESQPAPDGGMGSLLRAIGVPV